MSFSEVLVLPRILMFLRDLLDIGAYGRSFEIVGSHNIHFVPRVLAGTFILKNISRGSNVRFE
jgi:hypothetical protein